MATFHLRPVSDSPSPSPSDDMSTTHRSAVLPRQPPPSDPGPPSATHPRLPDLDLSQSHDPSQAHPRKYPAPPTGHDLMAMFPPAPPDIFPEMRPGPTSGFFQRQERAFFAQAGKEIVRVRLEVDLPEDPHRGHHHHPNHHQHLHHPAHPHPHPHSHSHSPPKSRPAQALPPQSRPQWPPSGPATGPGAPGPAASPQSTPSLYHPAQRGGPAAAGGGSASGSGSAASSVSSRAPGQIYASAPAGPPVSAHHAGSVALRSPQQEHPHAHAHTQQRGMPPPPHAQQSAQSQSQQPQSQQQSPLSAQPKAEFPQDDQYSREDPDESWRRPMPYAERRRAGKHTRRVIVRN
ncbi:hypothetical protein HGRIS_006911 [Hohenbuehelia grisea]|uniref:Uncharacterized protein n=1 Tax=Hohenbuehelia grisea TaxID=104357 RepID=A0ABR3JAE2_9AGAR